MFVGLGFLGVRGFLEVSAVFGVLGFWRLGYLGVSGMFLGLGLFGV